MVPVANGEPSPKFNSTLAPISPLISILRAVTFVMPSEELIHESSAEVIDTNGSLGAVVSIIIALFPPRESAAPGGGRVRMALTPSLVIVPPLRVRTFVFT